MDLRVPIDTERKEVPTMAQEKMRMKDRVKNWGVTAAIFDTVTFAGEVVMTDMLATEIQGVCDAVADTYDYHHHEMVYKVGGPGPFGKKVTMTPAQYHRTYGGERR